MQDKQLLISAALLRERLSYNPETGEFIWRIDAGKAKTGSRAGYLHTNGYRRLTVCRERFPEHRLAWLYMTGHWPKDQIDHINGHRSDNRFANLREVSNQENAKNVRARRNRSEFMGISWEPSSRQWRVRIKVCGKDKHLGYFRDKSEAIAARREANRLYGYSESHGSEREA